MVRRTVTEQSERNGKGSHRCKVPGHSRRLLWHDVFVYENGMKTVERPSQNGRNGGKVFGDMKMARGLGRIRGALR
ncbi:hypothetical protein F511_10904 [Dorcoceras hygrometricum]|uniref:Uncharacterized protein n=1 Tax=Dorcoceras hygrometricum TaxID=472368 RepID=A0A2Z7CXA8_9LAMI|nr:hypothetical protein F511_10904 [Dorcoceras hygrometricum]